MINGVEIRAFKCENNSRNTKTYFLHSNFIVHSNFSLEIFNISLNNNTFNCLVVDKEGYRTVGTHYVNVLKLNECICEVRECSDVNSVVIGLLWSFSLLFGMLVSSLCTFRIVRKKLISSCRSS